MKNNRLLMAALALLLFVACQRRQAGLSEYHEALQLMEQGDAPSALERLERAAELATTDSLRALVHSQMGTLYFSQRLLDRSLDSYRRAYAIDLQAADTTGLIYDLRDMGNVLRATDNDSCLHCFEQARSLAIASGDLPMQRDVESQMAAYHLYHNHLDEARVLLWPALEYVDEENRSGFYYMLADYYSRAGLRDSATRYYRLLLTEGNIFARQAAHRALAEQALVDGQGEQAMNHLQQYEKLTDSVHQANDAEGVRQTAALYDYTRHQRQAAHLQHTVILAVGTIVLLLLSLLALLLYFSRRRLGYRLKLQRLEQLLADYERKKNASPEPSPTPSPVIQQIERLLADVRQPALPDELWSEVETAVSQQQPDFQRRLDEFCRLTPQERRVCLLLRLGLAPTAIAQLTAHTKQAVTNTRTRLYKKAFGQKGTPAQWDEFILSL